MTDKADGGSYAFTLDRGREGLPVLRTFMNVSRSYVDECIRMAITARLLGKKSNNQLVRDLVHMELTARYSSFGCVYLVHTKEPMERDELEQVLQYKHKHGELIAFLDEAVVLTIYLKGAG